LNMRNDLWICCNLFFARLEIKLCQASGAYVMTVRIAYLYTVTRLENDVPHVALEHLMRLLQICSSFFSKYCVWGNQSSLQSSIIHRYFIFQKTFNPHAAISGWLLYLSLSLKYIGINADLTLEISSLCFVHQTSMVRNVFTTVVRTAEWEGPESLAVCCRRMLPFPGLVPWIVVQLGH